MLNDALPQILPSCMRFGIFGVFGCGEDVVGAEVRAVCIGDYGPAHKFGYGEEFEEASFFGDEVVAGVEVDAVKEIRLFVVVGG